jgi:hypothetical protein
MTLTTPAGDLAEQYRRDGVARLPGAFTVGAAEAMAEAVWSELERVHGIRSDDRSTWPAGEVRGLGRLRTEAAFRAIGTAQVEAVVTALVPERPPPPHDDWGGPLVTFPAAGTWRVPADGWHLDDPVRGAPASRLVLKWLAYLAPVATGGGGTVVIAGSHRLVAEWAAQAPPDDPGRSATVRDAVFGLHPWFAVLRRGARDAERDEVLRTGDVVQGVPVRVVDLVGEPGDVVFMHPHTLHAAAPNAADHPRLMVTGGLDVPR